MPEEGIEAWRRLAYAQAEALKALTMHVRQLALATAALMATLDESDRTSVGDAALADIGDGIDNAQAARMISAFTRDPAAALTEQWASVARPASEGPLGSW